MIARWRMRSQLMRDSPATSPADVLAQLAASQGQDILPSAWALSQRIQSPTTEADVLTAYDSGAILRTHVLRPTWHFVHPADLRWLLTATAPRVHRINGTVYRAWGFTEETFATIRRTIETTLADGSPRTRTELGRALESAGLPLTGQGLAYAVMHAELEAILCSGPRRGKQHTYVLLDSRVPDRDDRTRPEALAELARRYYTSRGPASHRDLAGWASLTLAEASQATEAVAAELGRIEIDEVTYWHSPADPPAPSAAPRVELVNGLDELVMSYSHTREVLAGGLPYSGEASDAMYHAILTDGQLTGLWTYRRDSRGRPDQVIVRPLRDWSAAERDGVHQAARRFGSFAAAPQLTVAELAD